MQKESSPAFLLTREGGESPEASVTLRTFAFVSGRAEPFPREICPGASVPAADAWQSRRRKGDRLLPLRGRTEGKRNRQGSRGFGSGPNLRSELLSKV